MLHLHLQGKGGHRGQRAAGKDEGADALADQLAHTVAGTEAPVAQHLPSLSGCSGAPGIRPLSRPPVTSIRMDVHLIGL